MGRTLLATFSVFGVSFRNVMHAIPVREFDKHVPRLTFAIRTQACILVDAYAS